MSETRMKAEELEKLYSKRAVEIGAQIAGHMGLLYGDIAIDAFPIVKIISKELDKAERTARREALEEAAEMVAQEPLRDPNPSAYTFDGWYKARELVSKKICALADEGGKA